MHRRSGVKCDYRVTRRTIGKKLYASNIPFPDQLSIRARIRADVDNTSDKPRLRDVMNSGIKRTTADELKRNNGRNPKDTYAPEKHERHRGVGG